MNESKIRKAYELINKRWTNVDVVEHLSITYNQLHAIKYGMTRQAKPYQLVGVLKDVDNGMSFSEIDHMIEMALAGKPYGFTPAP